MPPVKKIDLLPDELKDALRKLLKETAYGDIHDVTARLNEWLRDEDIGLSIGKTAVGKYAQFLKHQQAALEAAEVVTAEIGIEGEAKMHKAIMQMIAGECINLMTQAREPGSDGEEGAGFNPLDLARLAKMLNDLMNSAGIREKISADERARAKQEAREEAAKDVEKVVKQAGLSKDLAASIISGVLGVPETTAAAS
jgi:hypothetical protein